METEEHPWPVRDRMEAFQMFLEMLELRPMDDPFPGPHRKEPGAVTNRQMRQMIQSIGPDYENNLDAIDEITEEPRHTRWHCHECNELADRVIVLGVWPPEIDLSNIHICLTCLKKAQAKLENPPKESSEAS